MIIKEILANKKQFWKLIKRFKIPERRLHQRDLPALPDVESRLRRDGTGTIQQKFVTCKNVKLIICKF